MTKAATKKTASKIVKINTEKSKNAQSVEEAENVLKKAKEENLKKGAEEIEAVLKKYKLKLTPNAHVVINGQVLKVLIANA